MDVYLSALIVTSASLLCFIFLIRSAYKSPLG
jgi:hypothetical protein